MKKYQSHWKGIWYIQYRVRRLTDLVTSGVGTAF